MDFEDVIISAAEKKQPHIICNYVYEIATLFHSYYGSHKIITDNEFAHKFEDEPHECLTVKFVLFLVRLFWCRVRFF